ncbi:bifunctional metallophosphatase/5'-nucleotidase [Bacillus sp. JJ722]|uniref:bifunctional metallophosphatase/5'-nucleotidase n=1 Tax=Bacillus sp. JJ722 TaxID=3122973 RepID=UPI002FFF911C
MEEKIHLYHINDLHSHFEHWQRIEHFIHDRKAWHSDVGEETIVVDIGDHADRFHPYTEASSGKGNVELLNQLGCQFATIGNNEGITFPYEALNHLYDDAEFKVVLANLYDKNEQRPKWALPYSIHTTNKGTRIAFIGATAYFRLFYESLGWNIKEPLEEIRQVVRKVKDHSDMLVLLSHLGLEYDELLANEIPELNLIFGGHTHHILHEGKYVNDTLLCGAGKWGTYVGHVEITVDKNKKILQSEARLYNMNEQNLVQGEKEFGAKLYKEGKEKMTQQVCQLPDKLVVDWFKETPLVELLCRTLKEWCDADCAFLNAGLLLDELDAGPVTLYDLHRICPHPINPCVIEIKGSELKEVIIQSTDPTWPHMQIKGFGFRGNVLGTMVYSDITMNSHHEIWIGNDKLDTKRTYRLAIPDMFTFGFFFPAIKRSEKKAYYLPEFLRDLLAYELKRIYP